MTLSEAAKAAISEFNFGFSHAQLQDDELRVSEEFSSVTVKIRQRNDRGEVEGLTEANNEINARAICTNWGKRIAKHYKADFSVSVCVKGKIGLYSINFYYESFSDKEKTLYSAT